jgi:hypothetical protein
MDNDLNSSNETTPDYPEGYWLKEKGNGAVLNDIMNYLRRKHNRAEVKAQINQRGEVVLNIQDWYEDTKILFPVGFPYVAPYVEKWRYNRRVYSSNPENWNYMNNNIPGSFIHFYEFN